MTKIFKVTGSELVEQATVLGYNESTFIHWNHYAASLTRYTINPSEWNQGEEFKEGEFDWRYEQQAWGWWVECGKDQYEYTNQSQRRLFAIPKRKEQGQEEDLFKTAMDNDWSAKKAIAYILDKYTLTKK